MIVDWRFIRTGCFFFFGYGHIIIRGWAFGWDLGIPLFFPLAMDIFGASRYFQRWIHGMSCFTYFHIYPFFYAFESVQDNLICFCFYLVPLLHSQVRTSQDDFP